MLDVREEAPEVAANVRAHPREPRVDEPRDVEVVGRGDRRVAHAIGRSDAPRRVLHDDELPRRHRQEPLSGGTP